MNDSKEPGTSEWVDAAMREHESALFRYAVRITGDAELARDATQDVFLRLCKENSAELNGRLRPWLYRVCRNRAIELRRKESRMQSTCESVCAGSADRSGDPAMAAEKVETTSQVARLVSELAATQQEVIRLRFEHGLSYKEIAAVLDLTVSNVGVLIHTAIKALRSRMAEQE